MADSEERSPLLSSEQNSPGPSSSAAPTASETTPLLSSSGSGAPVPSYDGASDHGDGNENGEVASPGSAGASPRTKRRSRRWPSIIAILLLAVVTVAIIAAAYVVPDAVEDYAKEGAVVEPTNLSLESITTDGIRARIQANFRLDATRVKNEHNRRIGRVATSFVRKLGTEETKVDVYLPEYGNVRLGSAIIPPLVISLVDGQTTSIDFVADLKPGDAEGIRTIANQWLEGRLDILRVQAKADIPLKTGFIPLGTHSVSEALVFEAKDIPKIPAYSIDRINFEEVDIPGVDTKAMAAEVLVSAFNKFPFQLDVPPLGFEILVPNCDPLQEYILVADAFTDPIAIRPDSLVTVEVNGTVRELPKSLTTLCPDSESSPLDLLLKQYMSGDAATVFVRGKKQHSDDTPDWVSDILSSVTVPIPFPGRTFDNLIRNFSLTDVHFTLPDPMAEPGDPASNPTVSGTILVTAALPSEMNFAINVTKVRADADVFYHGDKLGELDLHKWQAANSTRHPATEDSEATLTIQSRINEAPLNVTDSDVLADVIQKLLFGGDDVELDINALVDIRVDTVLGKLELKDVPAAGKIPVKPLPGDTLESFDPQVGGIEILDTTPSSITLEALVNISNPTEYTAYIPFISIHVLCNDTIIGVARAKNLSIIAGNNTNILVGATWSPSTAGKEGKEIGRDLLSGYISGLDTNFTVKAYHGSIPGQPILSEALSKLNFTMKAPRLRLPGTDNSGGDEDSGDDDDDDSSGDMGFIRDATFHVFSSTASFILASPLTKNTLYVEKINATAFYNHTEPVGSIISDTAFPATPGLSSTPKLPVEWSPDSVGFDKLRKALGGDLKLDARAVVTVRLGAWRETIWYVGQGIGAHIRM